MRRGGEHKLPHGDHRFLAAARSDSEVLKGIVEADETYVLESRKGARGLGHAKARRRGGTGEEARLMRIARSKYYEWPSRRPTATSANEAACVTERGSPGVSGAAGGAPEGAAPAVLIHLSEGARHDADGPGSAW